MSYISEAVRRLVANRAGSKCEYCLIHESYTIKRHEPDHIYAEKHGGGDGDNNLAFSCFDCNRHKGSDLASLDNDNIVRLFHPRRDNWTDHFRLNGASIEGVTPIGRVTVRLLNMNHPDRVEERRILIKLGLYP